MGWHARLDLRYRLDAHGRCIAHDRHAGPLRVLRALHPEGASVCHHVVVHPPAGVVGGDTLAVGLHLERGAHALLTTPGATRFYRSAGETAQQCVEATVADDARLEWLPQETICHAGAVAASRVHLALAPRAEAIGWDVVALGLPASGEPFDRGCFRQSIEVEGAWLERGTIDAVADARLLDSPLGLAGRRVLATLWFAGGSALAAARREVLLEGARELIAASPLAAQAGATAPGPRVVVVRALADRTEPAMALLRRAWAGWRQAAWGKAACVPRVWGT